MPTDLKFVLMVGGSTYIPLVRKRVEELLQIPVITDINPTNAIVVGAAYYAGTIEKEIEDSKLDKKNYKIKVKMAYQKFTQEKEEFFAARVEGNVDGLFYKIIREDGGFDSGLKNLTNKISEDLPLVEESYNSFKFLVYDKFNNKIEIDNDSVTITHGLPPPPHGSILSKDISLELDEIGREDTFLRPIFLKNDIVPNRKKLIVQTTKNISRGSHEDAIYIKVYEGPSDATPESNLKIGELKIDGTKINKELPKNSEVEITIEYSHESAKAIAYIQFLDQEFIKMLYLEDEEVKINALRKGVENLILRLDKETEDAKNTEEWEIVNALEIQKKNTNKLYDELLDMPENDITDRKFKVDSEKRKISYEIDSLTRGKKLSLLRKEYKDEKEMCLKVIEENGNDYDKKRLQEIIANEDLFLNSNNIIKVKNKIDSLVTLRFSILWRTPSFLVYVFNDIKQQAHTLNNQKKAKDLIDWGKIAIENEEWGKLANIDDELIDLLPTKVHDKYKGTTFIVENKN